MSISDQIINGTYKKGASNSTANTSSISNSIINGTYSDYLKKKREEEEEKRRAEQEKQKNNTVSSTNNTNDFASKINTSSIEELQKEYDKLPTAEKTKIAKEIQEETNNSMGKLGLTQNTLNTAPLTNLDEDKLTEVGSLKEKVNNLKTDASSILKNLDLSVENAILQGQKMFNVATDKVLNDKNKLMLENAKTLSKISGDDSYNSFMDSSVSRLLTQEVDSTKGIQSIINNNNTRIQNNTDKTTNKISEKLSEITGGAGTTIVGGALSVANPALGTAFFTTSAAGGYYDEALERGMDKDKAQVYAGIMGCMEGVTESVISAERIKGAKSILEGTGFKNAVKSFGLEVGENFLQEAVMPSISEGTALLTGGKESLKYDLSTLEGVKELLKDSLNDGIDGALSAILLGGVTRGSAKCIQVVTNINNGLKPSKIQVEQAVKEAEKSGVNTQEILKNEIVYQAEKNIDNTNNITNQNTQVLQNNMDMNVENAQQSLYNNNESESGLNGERGKIQGNKEILGQYDTRIQQESEQQEGKKYTRAEFEKWEQSIKPIEYRNLTNEQKQVSSNIKRQYGKDIVFFDGDNTGYNGGASINDSNKIYVNANQANEFGVNRVALHEVLESNIAHNQNLKEDIIIPIIDAIQQDPNFQEQKNKFWENQEGTIPSDYAIAKDIICDRFAEIESGEGLDYDNVLSQETNMTIDFAISNFNKQASNNTQINQNVAPSAENNVAETGEWTKRQKNQTKKYTRKEVRNRLFQEMQISPEELSIGDDIKAINYQITDPVRVNEKVFGKKLGDKINNATINKTKHNTAEKIRWQNKERQEIQDLGIKARSKESAAVQKYGEKQWVDNNGNIYKYGDTELATEFPNIETQNKIKNAAQVIRNKYDLYIDQINDTLTELGYDAIPKRKDYMRHFQELGDVFSQTGVPFNLNDLSAEDLPTDINGLTEFNKPGKNWFASSQKRYGNKTTYDAITGIDGYLEGAGNLIFHTEDVQNYRALSEAVRNQFGQTKGFENLEGLTDEQIKQRIEDIQSNKLSKYVAWLDEQANALAGKKGAIDRGVERAIGRRGYTVLNTLKKQVGSNMTGFNVRSSLTNFISSTIASAKTNKIALAKGTISTINNMFHNDGFIEKSDFLTSRFGSNSLSAKTWQKISNAGQIFMTGSDYFTSNLIARSKYYEGLQKGMTEQEALRYSNDFSSRVMGDRSQGATPEAFNSKTLGLFTQFQLEVNNQWQYMIHDTKMDYQQNMKKNGGLKAGATALFQMGQLAAYSYFFNELFEKVTGSRAAFDPIEIFKVLFGIDDDDEDKTFDEKIAEAGEMLVDNLPFGNLITGGGRIPIADAFEGIGTLAKKLTNQKNKYGGDITWKDVGSDMLSSLPYWVSPTGYSQGKKFTQGLNTVINNGDYNINTEGEKELKFPVENKNALTYIKAGLFGKYSLPTAQEYIDNNFKKLSAKQTTTYEESNIPYNEYLQYLNQGLSSTKDKINYIENTDWTESQKWSIYKNDVLSNIERKDGSSQASDAEYITTHGVGKTEYMKLYNKAQENNIDTPTKEEYINLKNSGVSLENYIDYNVKVKKITNELKKNGKLTDTQTLKEKDKIEILINSNYSSKETQGIYEACILSSNDKKYSIIKSTNMDITQYLQYKLADDNDELNSKQKVWNYIENMNITHTQKLLLYGLEYTPSDSQQQQIINYVKSLPNKTNKEKLEILSQFKGFTIYEDGTVKY